MSATIRSIFLLCRDLRASTDFYRRLGFALRKSGARTTVFQLSPEGPELHLHAPLTPAEEEEFKVSWQPGPTGMVLSFETADLDALIAGAPPEALLVSPRSAPWGTRMAMLVDPDGYRLEFQARGSA
jgi:catechol 2,3-dioxygenase-like lactoylglutathione lyase family enzyme